MTEWILAAIVVLGALVPCLVVCLLADLASALAALEVAGTLAVTALLLLSEGFHRQPFVDLALLLAFLAIVGGLVFARMMESDL